VLVEESALLNQRLICGHNGHTGDVR